MTEPTPEQKKLIEEAMIKAASNLKANTDTVVVVYGNARVSATDGRMKILKGSD